MKLRFTRQEFLARWRVLRGYAPLRNDVALTRSDGLDFDSVLEAEMDSWYRRLLLEGDGSLLAPEELADVVALAAPPSDGGITVSLPREVIRVVHVRLTGWRRAATIVTDPESNMARRQLHPYTRACVSNPVGVFYPGGELALYPATSADTVVTLQCVMCRDDEFAFDSAALCSFPLVNSEKQ